MVHFLLFTTILGVNKSSSIGYPSCYTLQHNSLWCFTCQAFYWLLLSLLDYSAERSHKRWALNEMVPINPDLSGIRNTWSNVKAENAWKGNNFLKIPFSNPVNRGGLSSVLLLDPTLTSLLPVLLVLLGSVDIGEHDRLDVRRKYYKTNQPKSQKSNHNRDARPLC